MPPLEAPLENKQNVGGDEDGLGRNRSGAETGETQLSPVRDLFTSVSPAGGTHLQSGS